MKEFLRREELLHLLAHRLPLTAIPDSVEVSLLDRLHLAKADRQIAADDRLREQRLLMLMRLGATISQSQDLIIQ